MKTYFITGTSRGIGLELCKQLLQTGNKVIATSRTQSSELLHLEREYKYSFRWLPFDVSSDFELKKLKQEISEPIDIVIANAGLLTQYSTKVEELATEEMLKMYSVNVLGIVRTVQLTLAALRKSSNAKIISISSKVGSIADNQKGGAYGYRCSKSAVNMFNKTLSIELEPEGICCVAMHPGWVQTEMGGADAPTKSEESVNGILKVIDQITLKDTGRFFDFNGQELPF